MRIAVYHNLPSGGAKRALQNILNHLASRHEISVFSLSSADHDFCDFRTVTHEHHVCPYQPLTLFKSPFGRLNQGIRTLDLFRLRRLQREIALNIDSRDYDAVFVHQCQYSNAPSVLEFLRTPSIFYCQEPPRILYEPRIQRPYSKLRRYQKAGNLFDPLPEIYRSTLRRMDHANVQAATLVLANSAYSRESLYRTYALFATVCYLGVDSEVFQPLNLPKEDFLLSVGAVSRWKGFDFLLDSISLLPEEQQLPLVIVSNHVEYAEENFLRQKAEQLGLNISFKHLVTDEELVRLYNQARLMLYAPVMEPFGFAPLESMSCGTPVVAVAEGGVRESVVDGVTGSLVDRDPLAMATAICKLLGNPGRADRLGQNGRETAVNDWSWSRTNERIERVLESVVNQRCVASSMRRISLESTDL